jgi:hypothetical protein
MKQTINIGSAANDGTGDPLRTAFDKINDNFDELYTELGGTSLSNITLTGSTVTTDSASGENLTLSADGSEIIIDSGKDLKMSTHVDTAILYTDVDGVVTGSEDLKWDGSTLTFGAMSIDTSTGTIYTNSPDGSTTGTDIVLDPDGGDVVPVGNTTQSLGSVTNSWLTVWTERLNATGDRINIQNTYTPAAAIGASGDAAGDVAYDGTYLYVATGNYDGVTAIWGRIALTTGW